MNIKYYICIDINNLKYKSMKTEVIIIRVSKEFKKELEEKSKEMQMGYASYARMAIQKLMNEKE